MIKNIEYQKYKGICNYIVIFILLFVAMSISGCDKSKVNSENYSPALTLIVLPLIPNYSTINELLQYNYLVTNTGNVSLKGPVIVSDSRMQVSCPELVTIGNADTLFTPNESIVCSSSYFVTQEDLDIRSIVNTANAIADDIISTQVSITLHSIAESLFIFPFDTSDPGVVFRSTLTSSTAIQQAGGTEEVGSLNDYDDILGMKPRAVTNGIPGCRFGSSSIAGLASLPTGQLSIEVEREWLAITDTEVGSTGYDHDSIEYLFSYGSAGVSSLGRLYMQPDEYLLSHFIPQEGTRRARFVNTTQSTQFARITISWVPDEASLYVDGLLVGKIDRTNQELTKFSNIYIGTLGGLIEDSFKSNHYVRNLIVANKPVTSVPQPLLRHIMQLGDSFSSGLPLFNVPNKYDGTIANTIIRELFINGNGYEKYTAYSNGGGKIQDVSDDPIELDVTNGASKTRADALTEDPSIIIFITGGNDISTFQDDIFSQDIHDHIEAFMGVNGHVSTNVQHVIVTTTTSKLNASSTSLLGMRDIMLALPNWWDTTYPEQSGKVHVVDTWQIFGGLAVDLSLFGIVDPVHPSAAGDIAYGRSIVDEIMPLVR